MSATTEAWQATLAAEQQAVFAYSVLGAKLSGTERARAAADQAAHETLRDTTAAAIVAAGLTPVQPQADYPAVYPAAGTGSAVTVAVRVEEGCAAAWRYLYALAPAAQRSTAQTALTASAVRAVRWRRTLAPSRPTTAFPGL